MLPNSLFTSGSGGANLVFLGVTRLTPRFHRLYVGLKSIVVVLLILLSL